MLFGIPFLESPLMETRQLQHFLVVAKARTLTEAAEALHITQPALSMSIRRLEETLGVSLFRRERRQMVLTEAGKVLLSRAEAVLSAEEALRLTAKELAREEVILRVAFCDPGPYWYFVPRLAATLASVTIEPVLVPDDCTPEALRSGRYDCVVSAEDWKEDDITSKLWAIDRTYLSLPVEHLDALRIEGLSVEKLADPQFQGTARLSDLRDGEICFLDLDGAFSRQKRSLHASLHPSVKMRVYRDFFLFRQDLMTSKAPTFTTEMVRTYRDDGTRRLVLMTDEKGDIGYRLCWRRGDENRDVLRRFLELAFEHAKGYEAAARSAHATTDAL